jgi:hypothetical protein
MLCCMICQMLRVKRWLLPAMQATVMPATRVAGREVQRNEVALCDLTGEVPGTSARAWKVEKVEVVEL